MLALVFSTYSSGSTFLQTRMPDPIKIINRVHGKGEDIEFGFMNWAARYIYYPNDTIDVDPSRVFDPASGKQNDEWRERYRENLGNSKERNEDHFLEYHAKKIIKNHNLKPTTRESHQSRLEYVIELLKDLDKKGKWFGKNPKWLNDFRGDTFRLLDEAFKSNIDIRGIFLKRRPHDVFRSIFENKYRFDEVFGGNEENWVKYVLDSIIVANIHGQSLSRKYGFLEIEYENLERDYERVLEYLSINSNRTIGDRIGFQRKSVDRFYINPYARNYSAALNVCAEKLGYSKANEATLWMFFLSLMLNIYYSVRHGGNVAKNRQPPKDLMISVFDLEWRVGYLKRIRRLIHSIRNQ